MVLKFNLSKRILSDSEQNSLENYLETRLNYSYVEIWNIEIIYKEGLEINLIKVYANCKNLSNRQDLIVLNIPIWNILKKVEYYEAIKQEEISKNSVNSSDFDSDDDDLGRLS